MLINCSRRTQMQVALGQTLGLLLRWSIKPKKKLLLACYQSAKPVFNEFTPNTAIKNYTRSEPVETDTAIKDYT